jgi:hypothetical protein
VHKNGVFRPSEDSRTESGMTRYEIAAGLGEIAGQEVDGPAPKIIGPATSVLDTTGFLLLRLIEQAEFDLQEEYAANIWVHDICLCNLAHHKLRYVAHIYAYVFHAE